MLRFRESRTTIARNSERRKVRWLLNGYRVDILQGEKSSGVWLQKMQTYLILLKWTLESESEVAQSVQLFVTPWTVVYHAPLSKKEYWSGLQFSSPRDFPGPEIKPRSPAL